MSNTPGTPAGWYSDPDGSSGLRYWDGVAWTDHRSVPGAAEAGPQAAPRETKPVGSADRNRLRQRRPLWQTIPAAFVILLVGIGIGAAGGNSGAELSAAKAKASDLNQQLQSSHDQNQVLAQKNAELATQADESRKTADNAVAAARQQAKKEYRSKFADLKSRSAALDSRKKSLDRRERRVSGMERSWAANAIPGDGIFLVGKQIQPGIYQAAASPGCYYARLSSLDTFDIIDNNNVDGPVVLQVLPSDTALELSGCSTFHKVE